MGKLVAGRRPIYISVVNHNQWHHTLRLLCQLSDLQNCNDLVIVVVANTEKSVPDDDETGAALDKLDISIRIIRNQQPRGFAANHNYVFKYIGLGDKKSQFVVLNPDICLMPSVIERLRLVSEERLITGVIAPRVIGLDGCIEDHARTIPTPFELFKKIVGYRPMWITTDQRVSFYPDWTAGMFMMFSTEAFAAVGGFDERYHLYYEDVDICSRLWLAGYKVMVDPSVSVIHDAQRTSHRNLRYLSWHAQSAARFFLSPTYRRARAFHKLRQGSGNIEGLIDSLPP